jgi:hypothetical protein
MNRYSEIDQFPDFVKDEKTGAIVNINKTKADADRLKLKREREREEEINKLKDDVGEIKDLLHKLLEKK